MIPKLETLCENCRIIEWCKECNEYIYKYPRSICINCWGITLLLCNECENPNWSNWSSGNKIVDDFIKECNKPNEILKWIPYNQFSEITYIAKGGFGEIYKAKWKGIYDVALKKLYNSRNITMDFLNEVKNYIHCMESNRTNFRTCSLIRFYGISYDPITQDFIIVAEYANKGNLKQNIMKPAELAYCVVYDVNLSSNENTVYHISRGLNIMHNSGLVHCDLHIGNILLKGGEHGGRDIYFSISDFGLCQPANISSSIKSSGIYGVIPYIAPEIFLGRQYTPASDIYSLGIIMWVIYSFEEPFNNRNHDATLILDIIRGLRPEISPKMGISKYIMDLMEKCWDSDPKNRPTAQQIITTLENHEKEPNETYLANLHRKKYSLLKTMNLTGNNPGTCYTSRFLSFQRVKEHLAKLTLEDSGQNDLSLPTSINDDNIKDFEDKIIALPTLSNTSPSQIP
ncbi:kinase-like domain-containing protein [Rhizophagus irregularis DAOM 181602=DAOM 197198]|uniref:Cdc15p n=2 Tax=Rhizophagus irregularis TaxID=588596 RepID=A0A015KYY4_RHIIW|nr:kinase-like domain-containing protein [Rhizophagus irregularis DAOM 181602=DAOM 197198]EXX65266.1 Cdc15p [Rhizophagus irregularis DAOM 197198w]POG71956.1 kinase-like domain-containing protein [Rhizophagus irregularis DAOM 181602=DAOM 197198]GBC11394.2 kinase-like domain-containing protein [Rhizophagus irregularis DAOM 181602=DAOM 197198]|eukprot:XP_025178822.1 kinase-like domain-containing protein [Rhizophagus irregularis DAOM 181602=DAOM 197198]